MFKKSVLSTVLITAVTLLLSGFSAPAQAGYKHHYRYAGHYDYHPYRYHNRRGYRYRHGRYHRHRHSNRGAYLAGGIALGALLSHAYHTPRYRSTHDGYVVREVVRDRPVVVRQGSITRRLFRDRDGNCFERQLQGGEELLIELPASDCNW